MNLRPKLCCLRHKAESSVKSFMVTSDFFPRHKVWVSETENWAFTRFTTHFFCSTRFFPLVTEGMGVPELLKVVARSASGALSRIPRGSDTFAADYALIDCTNAFQTLGNDVLVQFLTNPNIRIRIGFIFVLDGQRRRVGTSREQRVAAAGHENDVLVHQCMVAVAQHYQTQLEEERSFKRARHEKKDASDGSSDAMPVFSVCGRDVVGEGDYKMLHLHRTLVCEAAARGASQPSFLFVSEDSDLLCGALCGPAGQNVTIATKLHGTTFELCLLRVSHVLAYIGKTADVLLYATEESGAGAAAEQAMAKKTEECISVSLMQTLPSLGGVADADSGRRRKVDGPMVALGKKTRLDDDEVDAEDLAVGSALRAEVAAQPKHVVDLTAKGDLSSLSADLIEKGSYLQQASIDLVFLFMTILGNGAGATALVKGATKVDTAQCWVAYCANKYCKPLYQGSPVIVQSLLREKNTPFTGSDLASFELNSSFLLQILSSLNYSDSQSRPPSEEDRHRSMRFLECVVISTARYIVAAHRSSAATTVNGKWALLDSTLDAELADREPPNFVSLLSVLAEKPAISFTFSFTSPSSSAAGTASGHPANSKHPSSLQQGQMNVDVSLMRLVVEHRSAALARSSRGVATRPSGQMRQMAIHELFSVSNKGRPLTHALRTLDEYISTAVQPYAIKLTSPFHRLLKLWEVLLATAVPQLQRLLLGQHQNDAVGSSKPFNPASSRPVVAQAYSFELRRLAPIAATTSDSKSNNPAMSAALRAAGLAFDYAAQPVRKPHSQPVSAKTGESAASPIVKPNGAPRGAQKKNGPAACTPGGADADVAAGVASGNSQKKKKKKLRRLGKKERSEREAKRKAAPPPHERKESLATSGH